MHCYLGVSTEDILVLFVSTEDILVLLFVW